MLSCNLHLPVVYQMLGGFLLPSVPGQATARWPRFLPSLLLLLSLFCFSLASFSSNYLCWRLSVSGSSRCQRKIDVCPSSALG
ncbi:hypothetical protein B0T20DRAFT_400368 [Sordaria brevicollis]|uniref:Uncharacterized protein n=1 Tax=Sordaria brevicollis TaxID=83679 RepID=A0AAE0PNN6_SORBR|nr:hypothetical protein B0T20DRAFT_400368 [Sordaria brevicollis]